MTFTKDHYAAWNREFLAAKARGESPLQEILNLKKRNAVQVRNMNTAERLEAMRNGRDIIAELLLEISDLESQVQYFEQFAPKAWELKFPYVSFTDKVAVYYADGTTEYIKHLYNDTSRLHEINWDDVVDCQQV